MYECMPYRALAAIYKRSFVRLRLTNSIIFEGYLFLLSINQDR